LSCSAEERCQQCGVTGTISLPLKEPLSPQISHYFTRPADLLEKVVQAEQFQESQLNLCLKRADINVNSLSIDTNITKGFNTLLYIIKLFFIG
jgi:hypothetical protein